MTAAADDGGSGDYFRAFPQFQICHYTTGNNYYIRLTAFSPTQPG